MRLIQYEDGGIAWRPQDSTAYHPDGQIAWRSSDNTAYYDDSEHILAYRGIDHTAYYPDGQLAYRGKDDMTWDEFGEEVGKGYGLNLGIGDHIYLEIDTNGVKLWVCDEYVYLKVYQYN